MVGSPRGLQVRPPRADSGVDLRKRPIALAGSLANNRRLDSVRGCAGWGTRQTVGRAVALRLKNLEPAPATLIDLVPWYFRAIGQVDAPGARELRRLNKKNSGLYWLVFSAPIPEGESMFAIRWHRSERGRLPISEAETGRWSVTPYRVRSLARRSLVPRGGGSLDLAKKAVLLVGCGSVGSELALRLTSAGVGSLTLSDPDTLSEKNLYRHTLSAKDIGRLKTEALAGEIALRHPWAEVTHRPKRPPKPAGSSGCFGRLTSW